jgi:hypothetical protein
VRIIGFSVAAAFAVLDQLRLHRSRTQIPIRRPLFTRHRHPNCWNPPVLGGPLSPATDVGLDKVASDGVSTRTVRAAPCSTLREGLTALPPASVFPAQLGLCLVTTSKKAPRQAFRAHNRSVKMKADRDWGSNRYGWSPDASSAT